MENFLNKEVLSEILSDYSDDEEYTIEDFNASVQYYLDNIV